MRARRLTWTASLAVTLLALALPRVALAATVQELVDLAEITYKMGCAGSASQIDCVHRTAPWRATIKPGLGNEDSLETNSREAPQLEPAAMSWMTDMHQLACGDPKAVNAFVTAVGALNDSFKDKNLGPVVIGNCTFTGAYVPSAITAPLYVVQSVVLPPPTTPPTAPPTTPPTAPPTAPPTTQPTAKPTAEPTEAAGPAPTASPTSPPAPSPSPAPSVSPTETAPPTPTPSPTPTAPDGGPVATGTPGPTAAPVGTPAPAPTEKTFEESVVDFDGVDTDGGAASGSLLLALLMLLIIGFVGELFNNTVENNYDIISAWFKKGPLGRVRRLFGKVRINPPGRPGVLMFIALTALISSFVDPGFGLNARSVAVFLGFLVGLIIVLASFKLPPILARRRRTGEMGQLRPLPWALVIAAVFVLVSRLAHLQPGYLYGIVLGAIFVSDASDDQEGKDTFWGSLWTLVAALLAWIALMWLRGSGAPTDGFGYTLLATAFAATLVAGLEAAAFALMPMRFLPGYAIYKWNRPLWAALWAVSLFAFFHILIGPSSGYVSQLTPEAFTAALGVFAAFGTLSIATWLYFRFRTRPEAA